MSSLKVGCIQKLNHLRYPSKTIRECVITQNASPLKHTMTFKIQICSVYIYKRKGCKQSCYATTLNKTLTL